MFNWFNKKKNKKDKIFLKDTNNSENIADVYTRLLKQRIIFIGEQITSEVVNRVINTIRLLEAEDPNKKIYLYLNTPGGDAEEALLLFYFMQRAQVGIITVNVGLCAGCGILILSGGEKGNRIVFKYSRLSSNSP